jgi:hypothetical protein
MSQQSQIDRTIISINGMVCDTSLCIVDTLTIRSPVKYPPATRFCIPLRATCTVSGCLVCTAMRNGSQWYTKSGCRRVFDWRSYGQSIDNTKRSVADHSIDWNYCSIDLRLLWHSALTNSNTKLPNLVFDWVKFICFKYF